MRIYNIFMDEVTNRVELCGTVPEAPHFSHESRGIRFFLFPLETKRLSGAVDKINVIARESLMAALEIEPAGKMRVEGELRSFNNKSGVGSRLVITVFARKLSLCDGEDENSVLLTGTVCKEPVLRVTPMDYLLAVLDALYKAFPNLRRVTTYAGPLSTLRKTPEELKAIRDAGLQRCYLGVETGDSELLKHVHKGVDADGMLKAGRMPVEAGFDLWTIVIIGLEGGGVPGLEKNAALTADIVNKMQPKHLSAMDEGRILIRGEEAAIKSPSDAMKRGIAMIQQHFSLVPTHTVTENIILGNIHGHIALSQCNERIGKLAESYGFDIPVDKKVGELAVGVQQKVEILKALYINASILIMDEPTAVLTPQEAEVLMDLLDKTIEQDFGISIDGNMEVDFDGFAEIIDSLGGVDITINSTEAAYMQAAGYSVAEGSNHMDGETALCYVRIRHVA